MVYMRDECGILETVEHVFFKCSKYEDQCRAHFRNIKNRPVSIMDLLGKGLSDRQRFNIRK